MMMVGERFGRLVVLSKDNAKTSKHDTYWLCRCDCGNMKSVTNGHLTAGTVKSCGCLKKELSADHFRKAAKGNITHGEAGSRLYNIWHSMKQRCGNPKNPEYKWYGGKGVKVCDEWIEYSGFAKWAHKNGYIDFEVSNRAEALSIDRIDSNGNYCPQNCRWITISENTRRGAQSRWEHARNISANRSAGTASVV